MYPNHLIFDTIGYKFELHNFIGIKNIYVIDIVSFQK